jgi:hypothetical protein
VAPATIVPLQLDLIAILELATTGGSSDLTQRSV